MFSEFIVRKQNPMEIREWDEKTQRERRRAVFADEDEEDDEDEDESDEEEAEEEDEEDEDEEGVTTLKKEDEKAVETAAPPVKKQKFEEPVDMPAFADSDDELENDESEDDESEEEEGDEENEGMEEGEPAKRSSGPDSGLCSEEDDEDEEEDSDTDEDGDGIVKSKMSSKPPEEEKLDTEDAEMGYETAGTFFDMQCLNVQLR